MKRNCRSEIFEQSWAHQSALTPACELVRDALLLKQLRPYVGDSVR